MIERDQPMCFPPTVTVRVSSVSDGTMLDKSRGVHHPEIVANRTVFVEASGLAYDQTVYQRIMYDERQSYDTIERVTSADTQVHREEVHADAIITTKPDVGLFLPVADCVATALYDPVTGQLALAHLGRHSTIANLMTKVIAEMVEGGANPADIIIWMAPSVKKAHYVMEYFDLIDTDEWHDFATREADGIHLDLQGYNRAAAVMNGVKGANIYISSVDTAASSDYFSHSNGQAGRFAVFATILP